MVHKILTLLSIFYLSGISNYSDCQVLSSNTLPNNSFCNIEAVNNDTGCHISWSYPNDWYYDDGTWEDLISSFIMETQFVVKFELPAKHIRLIGAEINVGDGSFPPDADFIGKNILLVVYDDNGNQGLPGTLLDSSLITVNNYGWVSFEGLDVVIDSGNFYLGVRQILPLKESPPIGIDSQYPMKNLSYVKLPESDEWSSLSNQDLLIRAITCVVNSNWQPHKTNNDIGGIVIARVSEFDPTIGETPEDGILTVIDTIAQFYSAFVDSIFSSLPQGYYAYGLKRYNYLDTTYGDWNYSNTILHTVGIMENKNKESFIIYPNPATSYINIILRNKSFLENTTLEIDDIKGKTLIKTRLTTASIHLDVKDLKKGMYIVKIKDKRTLSIKKFIIH